MEASAPAHVARDSRAVLSCVPATTRQLQFWAETRIRSNGWRLCAAAVRIHGRLDVGLLRECVARVASQHTALRTHFALMDGALVQLVSPPRGAHVETDDLLGLTASQAENEARRLAREFVARSNDLSRGPLFDAKILRLQEAEHALLMTADHMIADGLSLEILAREVWTLYQQALSRAPEALPQPSLQFAEHAAGQQQAHESWLRTHAQYWRERLSGVRPIEIPIDRDLQGTTDPQTMHHFAFGKELSSAIRDLARRERLSPAIVMLASYAAVMASWCERRDVVLTCAMHGRYRPELINVVGLFAHLLRLRIEIDPRESFRELLRRISAELDQACAHRDADWVPGLVPECRTELFFNWLPGNRLFKWLPVNQTFNWLPPNGLGLGGKHASAPAALRIQPFPLDLVPWPSKFCAGFYEGVAGIHVAVAYRRDLLADASISRFAQNLRSLAAQFTKLPSAPMGA